MALEGSKAQADKKAAEERTAEAAEQQARESVEQTAGTDQTTQRTDSAPERRAVDAVLDPYPEYESKDRDELRSLAEGRGVEINRDVEKAMLIKLLRDADAKSIAKSGQPEKQGGNVYASYDVMPLEEIRKVAEERGVELDEEFETAHLITELRAADSGVAGTGVSVRLADGSQK